jgi:hypothetical protein
VTASIRELADLFEKGRRAFWIAQGHEAAGETVAEGIRAATRHALPPVLAVAERDSEARRLLEYALHLRMHGERAPGGNETWAEFDRRCEAYLRSTS